MAHSILIIIAGPVRDRLPKATVRRLRCLISNGAGTLWRRQRWFLLRRPALGSPLRKARWGGPKEARGGRCAVRIAYFIRI